jgi:hypothetical protein
VLQLYQRFVVPLLGNLATLQLTWDTTVDNMRLSLCLQDKVEAELQWCDTPAADGPPTPQLPSLAAIQGELLAGDDFLLPTGHAGDCTIATAGVMPGEA